MDVHFPILMSTAGEDGPNHRFQLLHFFFESQLLLISDVIYIYIYVYVVTWYPHCRTLGVLSAGCAPHRRQELRVKEARLEAQQLVEQGRKDLKQAWAN